jgi:hypothetical protein
MELAKSMKANPCYISENEGRKLSLFISKIFGIEMLQEPNVQESSTIALIY